MENILHERHQVKIEPVSRQKSIVLLAETSLYMF